MGTISLSLPSDGSTIDAADVNTPFNTISAEINGNLDNDNIKTAAAISGTKLGALTTPLSVLDANGRGGWIAGVLAAPNTITANGNRSYDVVFNSTDLTDELSAGMRLKLTRTVTAPTQCTSLNGSTQYYSKTSPAGMTFTNNFVVSAWVKLESYADGGIVSRDDGTNGWTLHTTSTGQLELYGTNGGAGNYLYVRSYQSIPLHKWVHVASQLDMSAGTTTTTTNYIMIDGVDVPVSVTRGGTNPTALIQAGNLEIGRSRTSYFDGKIAQVAIYSAKVTQATIKASMNQGLSGSETSLVSAYSLSNSLNDLSANANNLTANGGALATATDTPFTQTMTGVTTGTTNYGIITAASFSTNTTLTVQVPEGDTIPTSGGVSAVSYSTQAVPYGFPKAKGKWRVETLLKTDFIQNNATSATWYNLTSTSGTSGGCVLTIPIGEWSHGYQLVGTASDGTSAPRQSVTLSTANNTESDSSMTAQHGFSTGNATARGTLYKEKPLSLAAQAAYYLNTRYNNGTNTCSLQIVGTDTAATIYADLAL